MASLEFGLVGFARLLVDSIESSNLIYGKIGPYFYTIGLNYKSCNVVYIVIKLQFAIKNLVYVKSIC